MQINRPFLILVVLWTVVLKIVVSVTPVSNLTNSVEGSSNSSSSNKTAPDCCTRRATYSPPPPEPEPELNTAIPSTTLPQNYHLKCTKEESQKTACLNGGECTAVDLGQIRSINCRCPYDYTGRRCQEQKIDLWFVTERMRTANVATGVAVAVVITVAILLGVYIYIRWKRKRDAAYARQQREGPAVVPFRKNSYVNKFNEADSKENDNHGRTKNKSTTDGQLVNSTSCIMYDTDSKDFIADMHSLSGDVNRNNGTLHIQLDENIHVNGNHSNTNRVFKSTSV